MTATRYSLRAIVILGFGAALINTMPIWIAEISQAYALSDAAAGMHASVTLLAAALSCGIAASWRVAGLARGSAVLVPICLVVMAAPFASNSAGLALAASACLGAALGILTAKALYEASSHAERHKIISTALSFGLMTALLIYLLLPMTDLKSLWILAVLSLSLVAAGGSDSVSRQTSGRDGHSVLSDFPVLQFPFFVMMGAYWTYIELFASSLEAAGDLSLWLLGSLLMGVLGSLIAGKLGATSGRYLPNTALLCAAMSGAVSYLAPTFAVLGVSVLANGFFLYLYFPLYLAGRGTNNGRSTSERKMAIYLLGFALGGAAGAGLLHIAGFIGLAIAIAMAGLMGVGRLPTPARS
ncbi:hypothetical protein MUY21_07840 [Aliiroseovarius sp. S2029]|uniref:hypothetical protein n=1 Tax=Aliiroseovarius sp. S2029 TaxID=2936988 RepID=UPI0020BE62C6|nr:hypothetical protein [Aliiroseovarius sp. S2029]MCK8483945.1 hypothetical protein [Aliiroseovarius sp. S2029]